MKKVVIKKAVIKKARYKQGNFVTYIPTGKNYIIDSCYYKTDDELSTAFNVEWQPQWIYKFKDTSLAATENDLIFNTRHSIISLDILPLLRDAKKTGKDLMIINGVPVKITSQRYIVFQKSLTCCSCGLTGEYFAIERNIDSTTFHLNLYGKNSKGEEVLLTKDHIKPKSLGGKNHHNNYQTMCVDCNVEKASKYD